MDDILIEIDDRGEADLILAALNDAAAKDYRTASQAVKQANPVLADYHYASALRIEHVIGRFQDALFPDAEPPDEYEPPLPKDDYFARELLTIQRQSKATA